jgi:hypothetical protein
MTGQRFYSPLKIGLLIVIITYFLFTLHATFVLSWIGEWEHFTGAFSFTILVEDISGFIGLVCRFLASLIALAAIVFYFAKKELPAPNTTRFLRWILVFEAIYWLGLITAGFFSIQDIVFGGVGSSPLNMILGSLMSTAALLVESICIPIALFVFVYKLNPNKPVKGAIKWALITGTIYIFVFWLLNTSMWITTTNQKGLEYLTLHPQNLFSFAITAAGLFALAMFSTCFTKKSARTENIGNLNLTSLSVIIVALGMYFLWNYLSWILFGAVGGWSTWYAWFLGHNLDLWLLSLPLVGLPLLLSSKNQGEPFS